MSDEWDQAVQKLKSLTELGRIDWKPSHELPRRRKLNGNLLGPAYVAEVEGKRIAVYEHQYRRFVDENDWYWDTAVTMEFIDDELESEWVWPSPQGRFELLEMIRYQTSRAQGFLERFLADTA